MARIANDSAEGGAVRKRNARSDRMRAEGICPHDRQACRFVKRCEMGRADSCVLLLANVERTCTLCRRGNGGCAFRCFRRDGYHSAAERGTA